MIRKWLCFFAIIFWSGIVATAERIDFSAKIAIVDVLTILENSVAVQSINKEIEKINQNIEREMIQKEEELKKDEEDLFKKRGTISEEDFQKANDNFNEKVSEAQKKKQSRQDSLEKAHAEAMQEVHEATIEIISNLADEYNFNATLPSSYVLFVKSYLDITPEVIKRLNETLKTVKVNYVSPK